MKIRLEISDRQLCQLDMYCRQKGIPPVLNPLNPPQITRLLQGVIDDSFIETVEKPKTAVITNIGDYVRAGRVGSGMANIPGTKPVA